MYLPKHPQELSDQINAQLNSARAFFLRAHDLKSTMNQAEWELFLFDAGFNRGAHWRRHYERQASDNSNS